ncbi:MAG: hypothetical protein H8D23_36980 [Candidatus Brocadiales bacterium]|nr:hypothetical protein [Candidatus Brocadiales bacterium]
MTNNTEDVRMRNRLFLAITLVGTFLVCLLIIEVVIRILDPQSDLRRKDLFFQYEPFIGFEGIPDKKGVFANSSFKTTITHNNEGFRDVNHDKKNTQNKFRVITLGDSFTWGHGVENDQIYMKVLEEYVPNIETINMGGPGGDPQGELKVYTSRGINYEHDVVLVGFFIGNDIEAYYPDPKKSPPQWGYDSKGEFVLIGNMKSQEEVDAIRKKSEERYSPTKSRNFRSRISYWFTRHFQIFTFVGNHRKYYSDVLKGSLLYTKILKLFGIDNKRAHGFLNFCMENDTDDVKHGWKLLTGVLETMKGSVGSAGAKLYVLFIPQYVQTSQLIFERSVRKYGHDPSKYDAEKPNRELAKLCRKLGIDYLDLLPVMKEETLSGNALYYPRDGHWNVEGHRIAAREIYKDMKKRGWIK